MPSKSAKQARLMAAVAHNPKFAKKVGIPQSVGRDFHAADKRVGRFAKGDLFREEAKSQAARTAIHAGSKLPGTFSTLDEAILQSKQKKMTGEQWKRYLAPGRKIKRGDVEFSVRNEEFDLAGEPFKAALEEPGTISSDDLLAKLRSGRTQLGLGLWGSPNVSKEISTAMARGAYSNPELGVAAEGLRRDYGSIPAQDYYRRLQEASEKHKMSPLDLLALSGLTPDVAKGTKFPGLEWRTPRTKDYSEVVTTVKPKPGDLHIPSHFWNAGSGPGISWSRLSRQGPTSILEELQSDIHQSARKPIAAGPFDLDEERGYARSKDEAKRMERDRLNAIDQQVYNYLREQGMPEQHVRIKPRGEGRNYANPEGVQILEPDTGEWTHITHLDPRDTSYGGLPTSISNDYGRMQHLVEPYADVPFKNQTWIDHELNKTLQLAALRGDKRLALVSPEVMQRRYTDNPGLAKFYQDIVAPRFEKLGKRYGLPLTESTINMEPKGGRKDYLKQLSEGINQSLGYEAESLRRPYNLFSYETRRMLDYPQDYVDPDLVRDLTDPLKRLKNRVMKEEEKYEAQANLQYHQLAATPEGVPRGWARPIYQMKPEDVEQGLDLQRQLLGRIEQIRKTRKQQPLVSQYSTLDLSNIQRLLQSGVPLFKEGGAVEGEKRGLAGIQEMLAKLRSRLPMEQQPKPLSDAEIYGMAGGE